MPNNIYPVVTPQRPDAQGLPPFMQGVQYSRDRSQYDDAMGLQQMMNQAGVRQTMATQPSQIQANIAKNTATAQTAIPEAQYKTEGLRLENVGKDIGNQSAALKHKGEVLAKAMKDIDTVIEASTVLTAGGFGPGGFAEFKNRMAQAGVDPQLQQFLEQSGSAPDLSARLGHIKKAREQVNLEWAKIAAEIEKARYSVSTAQPNPWLEHVRLAARRLQRENPGMSEAQAQEMASMEVRSLQSGEGGIRQPSPEQRRAEAAAEAAGKLDAQLGMLPDGPAKERIRANLERVKKEIREASRPLPAAGNPVAGAMPIEQARELLKRNNTPENRRFFEDTYKVKP